MKSARLLAFPFPFRQIHHLPPLVNELWGLRPKALFPLPEQLFRPRCAVRRKNQSIALDARRGHGTANSGQFNPDSRSAVPGTENETRRPRECSTTTRSAARRPLPPTNRVHECRVEKILNGSWVLRQREETSTFSQRTVSVYPIRCSFGIGVGCCYWEITPRFSPWVYVVNSRVF